MSNLLANSQRLSLALLPILYAPGLLLTMNEGVLAQERRIEEVVVTARKRVENLQEVPDAVTAFSSETIQNAGIDSIGDFMAMTPNLNFQDGSQFRSGYLNLTLRGIGVGQQGWAPVTYVVDGVRTASLDALNSGSLIDIERIEVLRGPQSALYGAGAIAGAINVITKQPTNETELRFQAGYGKGNDREIVGLISGALVPDRLRYRVNVSYRDFDGLIDSASNGLDLDFEKTSQVRARLIFDATDALSLDLQAQYTEEENGSTYQDKIADPSLIDVFNAETAARRRIPGTDDRSFEQFSAKIDWELPLATLTSVTGYNNVDQDLLASVCWDDPDSPALDTDPAPGVQVGCAWDTTGPGEPDAYGSSALPGQPIDTIFDSADNLEIITHDSRLASAGDGATNWIVGFELLDREAFNGFGSGLLLAPDETFNPLFTAWNLREDSWWGVYAQVSHDVTDRLELTFAGRYDDMEQRNTQYADEQRSAIVQSIDESGNLVDTLRQDDAAFQPKVQVRYLWTEAVSVYLSWAEGYRAGYYNTGQFNEPESTTNYEGGIKSQLLDGRLIANAAVFHIDYSDQQFSTIIDTPPFRVPVTIPDSDINGIELESTWYANDLLTFSGGVGYLDAEQVDGITPPQAPEWTVNLQGNIAYPWINDWTINGHIGYQYTSSQFLNAGEAAEIPSTNFVNLRLGVASDHWRATLWARNVTDERTATAQLAVGAKGWERYQNRPRSYGVEVSYSY